LFSSRWKGRKDSQIFSPIAAAFSFQRDE
jgi:hypothetical protein